MRIRSRITITFTLFFGILSLILCLIIYFLSASARESIFEGQLRERIEVAENFFLEIEDKGVDAVEEIREKFLHTLPNEIEYYAEIESFESDVSEETKKKLPQDLLSSISRDEFYYWKDGNFQGIARIYSPGETDFVVLVMAEDFYGNLYLSKLGWLLVFSWLATLALTYTISFYFSKNVLKPIASKIKKANRISADNLDLRLTVYNEKDELGMLAMSFNDLLDRLQKAFELQKNFVRYASHEMKNPLTIMIGEAEVTLGNPRTSNEYILTIEKLKSTAQKLNVLVDHFLNLSNLGKGGVSNETFSIDELIMDLIVEHSGNENNDVKIEFNIEEEIRPEDLNITGDKTLLGNAIQNVIENAVKYSGDHEVVVITLLKKADRLELHIIDKGIGIPKEHHDQVFDPLFRSSNALNHYGTGIGLSIVKKIADLHGYKVKILSEEGEGTTFVIQF